MATEIKVWQVVNDTLLEITSDDMAADHLEKDLETWISNNPSMLGNKMLSLKRQHDVPGVGIIDLLCIDETGRLVVVEFKRNLTNREAVAQALDYASWLDSTTEPEIRSMAAESLGKTLDEAFLERFGLELQSLAPQNHRVLVVAPRLDSSAERIIDYLAERHGVDINAVFFRYAKTNSGERILVRTVLVQDRPGKGPDTSDISIPQLLAMANDRKVSHLVQACRAVAPTFWEGPANSYKGSFRYWLLDRMAFGVNVSGMRDKAPAGELHVWVPAKTISELTGLPDTEVRAALKAHSGVEAGTTDFIINLQTVEQANEIVKLMRSWADIANKKASPASSK